MSRVEKTPETWRQLLSPQDFHVCRLGATEPPFSGEHYATKAPGLYCCKCCDAPLFDSAAKYDSGCGWPSYFQPVDQTAIAERDDFSHNMHRIEILCRRCDAHLGHVFPDGPRPTGLRYCVNSASLVFKPRE